MRLTARWKVASKAPHRILPEHINLVTATGLNKCILGPAESVCLVVAGYRLQPETVIMADCPANKFIL